ncbi:hypothetical protein AXG93_939s1100 [Marchantia polymorpha subsp. ruderalis]|uniref:Integrase catalytic domain-containing protein n=1 Tax=Marchantia polymorpha subsp. ruderalis TaxID=1480154 RepID=A0A176VMG1_MARPO|nr:hypothetical protein AXG93_939s1100 [Marchantia polymorpha subsp. ruderalis]
MVPDTVGAKEQDRVLQRAKRYRLEGSHVLRVLEDASFNALTLELHPLPIMGLGYFWSLDFARPLPLTVRHHQYVLVMVEHFSKWIELVALRDKASDGVAYAFLDRVLSHYGALAEVLTDHWMEFQGEFQVLNDKTMIDHRTTSQDHPEVDGLAERVVQMMKRALHKYGLQNRHLGDRDIQLPWLVMGYGLVVKHPWLPSHHILCCAAEIQTCQYRFVVSLAMW